MPSPGRIEVIHVADRAFALSVRDPELTVDQPVGAGGDNDGPTPVELFVAALASCVACDAVRFLQLLPGASKPHQATEPTGALNLRSADKELSRLDEVSRDWRRLISVPNRPPFSGQPALEMAS
ncbi:OsmC family protein [Streptomyces sp. HUAS ZL42]|uniref:OsmC family protein n=1 Tax=Streptomyces sp. HUAS ZL42 TaxID=3231715 RepID=UPI00345EDE71